MSFLGEATGVVADALTRVCRVLVGDLAPAVPAPIAALGIFFMIRRNLPAFTSRIAGVVLLGLDSALILHAGIPAGTEFANGTRGFGGGVTGAFLALLLRRGFGQSGLYVAAALSAIVGVGLVADAAPGRIAGWVIAKVMRCVESVKHSAEQFLYEDAEEGDAAVEDSEPRGRASRRSGERRGAPPTALPEAEPTHPVEEALPESVDQAAGPVSQQGRGMVVPFRKAKRQAGIEEAAAARAGGGAGDEALPPPQEQLTLDVSQPYEIPPLSLLERPHARPRLGRGDRDGDDKARILEETLASFGVQAKVVEINRGPAITRFELQPGLGVKVASITSLANDIALNLATQDVRIEAPIPGKSAIGIEVPNREVSLVHLRDILDSREFKEAPSRLTVALGKDITGKALVSSLEKMLHLLIAGATGSGKSVCINSIITSLLYKAKPSEVKMLLIDPKMVELSVYDGIPHLISPVVTDPKKAAGALRWVVKEMERRYQQFVSAGVRDILRFNQAAAGQGLLPLPYVVVVIDELADLMMVAPVDVEDAIFRLAQMARASGIHLVVATQRPSVDVITGTIKANIPSRIAFTVSSAVDSRTILDAAGAEKLVGRGDMLFFPVGATKPVRAQGAYISEKELERVVSFVVEQGRPEFQVALPESEGETARRQEGADELFPQAVRIVVEAGQASVSLLQRKLPIGYARAARLIDAMEERGFVGPYEGSKPRDVLLSFQEYERLFRDGQGGGQ
ncbi:MAG: DNA translocase FtsK [Firmicutes bacterium]|nr:DNA translocase FtsK [Bacillota bacterium]